MDNMEDLPPEQRRFLENKAISDLDQAYSFIRDNLNSFIIALEALEELHPYDCGCTDTCAHHHMFWNHIKQGMATAILQAFKHKLDERKDEC